MLNSKKPENYSARLLQGDAALNNRPALYGNLLPARYSGYHQASSLYGLLGLQCLMLYPAAGLLWSV